MEPGTGKTITAFALVAQKQKKANRPFLVLVICPKNIIGSWEDELELHMDEYLFTSDMHNFSEFPSKCRYIFVVINYERARIRIKELLGLEWDFIILDESHRIKNFKAKTSKALHQLIAIYKVIMSGTPIPKNEIDLFSQFKFLNPRIWGSNFYSFAKRALKVEDMGDYKKFIPDKKKLEPYMEKASTFTYRLKLDDVAELPPKRNINVNIELHGKHRKLYNELETSFMTEYEGKRSTIGLSVTSLIRLHQLVGGHLVLENNDIIRMSDQPKVWWIIDKLEDLGKEKVIIFCRFTLEIELLAMALKKKGYKYNIMKGGMKTSETNRVRKAFQNPKGPQILIAQIQSVKEGNNFQKCCRYGIFYSKSLSFIDIEQCKARIYRNGQKRKVIYYHLIVKNSIDEGIETIVERKYLNAEEILFKLVKKRRKIKMAKTSTAKKTKVSKSEKPTKVKKTKIKEVKKTKKKSNLPTIEKPDFGIDQLSAALGVDARSTRLKLRKAGIEKSGKIYDFKNQKGIDSLVKRLNKKA